MYCHWLLFNCVKFQCYFLSGWNHFHVNRITQWGGSFWNCTEKWSVSSIGREERSESKKEVRVNNRGNSGFRPADYKWAEDEKENNSGIIQIEMRVWMRNRERCTSGICGILKFYSHDQLHFLLLIFPSEMLHNPHLPLLLYVELKGIAIWL